MLSLIGLLFALHASPALVPPGPDRATISVRAEAHAAALESELGAAALLEASRDLAAAPQVPEWPVLPSTPGVTPLFRAHQPEEWVSIVTRQLKLRDRSITEAAMRATAWVLAMPVRVQVSPSRVYVTVRFRAF